MGPHALTEDLARALCPSAASALFTQVHPELIDTPAAEASEVREKLDLRGHCAWLEHEARRTGNDAFGLQAGRGGAPDHLGALGEIALASPTLGDALRNLSHFLPYQRRAAAASFAVADVLVRFEYRVLDGRILHRRQDAELTLSAIVSLIYLPE
jgi:Arabinose-binding domain of AraC transcription regulator, N-term